MARQKVQAELVGGKSPRQRIWEVIRAKRQHFTLDDLSVQTNVNTTTTKSFLRSLLLGGWVEISNKDQAKLNGVMVEWTYRLVKDNGTFAPRVRKDGSEVTQGRGNELMWQTMRRLESFDFHELAAMASTEQTPIASTTAKAYLKFLSKAGYLAVTSPTKAAFGTGTRPARYKLIKYTGPRPPMVQRVDWVYDQNLNKVMWQPSPEELLDD
ncbi:hypothetical protein LIN78_02095 [Leeia sp. TBRC 13508]|uniref:Uncharacterized protein n=1 Tax=Leeia speluncae TaxID=2884804 RepID=A0ABS8D2C5_9NEIS|nr:hypothetical protein [Leeia speluncae]MCB6182346.1 hypothetical protein [Leeia speluncae]